MVECDGIQNSKPQQYFYNKQHMFEQQDHEVSSLESLSEYKFSDIYDTEKTTSIQYLYLHLIYDGKSIEYKNIIVNSTKFTNKG